MKIPAPEMIARCSPRVRKANRILQNALRCDGTGQVRDMLAFLKTPKGKHLRLAENSDAQRNLPKTIALLSQRLPYIPWWAAPGGGVESHHPYPGGWLIHNATNIASVNGLLRARSLEIESAPLLTAMLLHDWAKPRMLVWEGRNLTEPAVEQNHHIIAIAEATLRGFSSEVLLLLAGVHGGWWKVPEKVAGFLEETGDLLEMSDVAKLAKQKNIRWSTAAWIIRQGEESWYSATREAMQYVAEPLNCWIKHHFPQEDTKGITQLIFAWCDELHLAETYANGKESALERLVLTILKTINKQI